MEQKRWGWFPQHLHSYMSDISEFQRCNIRVLGLEKGMVQKMPGTDFTGIYLLL